MDEHLPDRSVRMRWVLYGALGAIIMAPLALGIVWAQRRPIARDYVDDLLKKKRVQASYELTEVGTNLQRIEDIVIGDPANPDLTADWAEVDTVANFFGVKVQRVRASGVRVKGRLVDGKLVLGSLDKLLPEPTDEPFELPDIDIALTDARMRLDTSFGPVGARLDGRGNLASVFKGKLALVAPRMVRADCGGEGLTAFVDVETHAREILVKGPVRAAQIGCGINRAESVAVALKVSVQEQLNRWRGFVDAEAGLLAIPGARFQKVVLRTDFTGSPDLTTGKLGLGLGGGSFAGGLAEGLQLDGTYRFAPQTTSIEANGTLAAQGLRPSGASLSQITQLGRAGEGTPAAPIVAQLQRAVEGLGEGSEGKARFTLAHEGSDGALRLNAIEAQSKSGARLTFAGSDPVRYAWQDGGLYVSGLAQLSGGGFPDANVQLSGSDGRWSGTARIAPLVAGETRIAIAPASFAVGPGGTRFDTRATIDARFGPTRIAGLELPVSLNPGTSFLSGCQPLAVEGLQLSGLSLGKTRFQTCFVGNEARIVAPEVTGSYENARFSGRANQLRYSLSTQQAWIDGLRATGRLGNTPFALNARSARYGGASGSIQADQISVLLGNAKSQTVFDLASLKGRFSGGSALGQFTGALGRIGNVPLNMTNGSGNWRYVGSALSLNGRVSVADQQAEPRFQPLVSDDFTMRYAGGKITGRGSLVEPVTGARVTDVDLVHQLSSATGRAILDVKGLTFSKDVQPEQLTRITLGVIANVEGSVSGRGEVRWNAKGVTSDGRFTTDGLNLAAAFGPVRQLKGDIVFTDLIGMQTAPGQTVTVAEINSGVQVIDGVIRYRLLPGLKSEIEGGRWPFSGGELILEPTILDLSESAERRLTFRIISLDAAKFVNQLQLENISATGVFDGVMPMIFDKTGGRVEAGNMIAREGGGTVSYIGEVSKENLGTFGSIAFDALKSMRYRKLAIDLSGPLDGEMVTQVRFNGVNQAPIVPGRQKLPIPIKIQGLTGIPFIFNVTIRAPFRGLLTMTRSFQDPSGLIQQEIERERLRQLQETQTEPDKPVQQ